MGGHFVVGLRCSCKLAPAFVDHQGIFDLHFSIPFDVLGKGRYLGDVKYVGSEWMRPKKSVAFVVASRFHLFVLNGPPVESLGKILGISVGKDVFIHHPLLTRIVLPFFIGRCNDDLSFGNRISSGGQVREIIQKNLICQEIGALPQ